MSLFSLSHNLVYSLCLCPSLDISLNIRKINKQECSARRRHGNAVNVALFIYFYTLKIELS